ncbi:MAG: DUF1269 domain-containing protein [Acidimicrobiales bacterium]|jgi:uncharacterized membrane protein
MAKHGDLFIFIGTYPAKEAAEADFEVVMELHSVGAVGSYDAAIVTKDAEGRIHVTKIEMAARHAGWSGAAAGALIGLLFPPAIVGTAIVGGAIGAVSGHLWRGMSRSDVRELGETIDAGEVALVVVGENKMEQTLDIHEFTAERHVLKNLDIALEDIDSAIAEAANEVG